MKFGLRACFRAPDRVEHGLATLIGQRLFALALGYEDLVDHGTLRHDPVLAAVTGKLTARRSDCAPLAGKATLNRLEHAPAAAPTRYHKIGHDGAMIERLFVDLFLDAYAMPPEEIGLDLDATDDPLHGSQEGRFFHGYYGCYCYLPLYVFCGDHLLAAKLRQSSSDASAGAVAEIERLVMHIRSRWPDVRIILRADSGFARDGLMGPPIAARSAPSETEPRSGWCEANAVDYVLGLARKTRLVREIAAELDLARAAAEETGKAARCFKDFCYQTLDSWSRSRRVVGKAEQLVGGSGEPSPNPVERVAFNRRDQPRRHGLGAQTTLRTALLRPRRDGEPDQRVPARSFCRPHLDPGHGRQSAPLVVCLDGLSYSRRCAGSA